MQTSADNGTRRLLPLLWLLLAGPLYSSNGAAVSGKGPVFTLPHDVPGGRYAADLWDYLQLDSRQDGTTVFVYAINPVTNRFSYPQVVAGVIGPGETIPGPVQTVPTDTAFAFLTQAPDVALNSTGGILIYADFESPFFPGDPHPYEIGYFRLDASGRPQGERTVAIATSSYWEDEFLPRVSMNESGQFVIVYNPSDEVSDPVTGNDVYYLEIRGSIVSLDGREVANIKVNQREVSAYSPSAPYPAVAVASDGSSVIVWKFTPRDNYEPYAIYARRLDSKGKPLGDEFRVSASPATFDSRPEVGIAADGSFIVVWSAPDPGIFPPESPLNGGVFMQRYSAQGNPLGTEVRVSAGGANESVVALAPDGRAVIAWNQLIGRKGILAQRVDVDGTMNGGALWVTEGRTNEITSPHVAMAASGDFLISWREGGHTQFLADSRVRTTAGRWISWDAPDDNLLSLPRVVSHQPRRLGSSEVPLNSITVEFSKPMDPTSFTASQVYLQDPRGQEITPVAVSPTSGGGNKSFLLSFPDQSLRGRYSIEILPTVKDSDGNHLDQNGNLVAGEAGTLSQFLVYAFGDSYFDSIEIEATLCPVGAGTVVFSEGFESWDARAIPSSWSLKNTPNLSRMLFTVRDGTAHSGEQYFRMAQFHNNGMINSVVLALDVSNLGGQTNLVLDFWFRRKPDGAVYFIVDYSADGETWVDTREVLWNGGEDRWTHATRQLANATLGFQRSQQLYIRFRYAQGGSETAIDLDDVRVLAGNPPPASLRSAKRRADGQFELTLVAEPDKQYLIEASEDLIHWALLRTETVGATGTVLFIDPAAASLENRFYRALRQP